MPWPFTPPFSIPPTLPTQSHVFRLLDAALLSLALEITTPNIGDLAFTTVIRAPTNNPIL